MGVLDKFLDAIKLNDDYDDDGFLDDDLLDEEEDDDFLDDDFDEKPKKKFFDKFSKKKESDDNDDFDDVEEKAVKTAPKQASAPKQTASAPSKVTVKQERAERQTRPAASSKITPMRSSRKSNQGPNMEVCVIKPSSMEDTREIAETIHRAAFCDIDCCFLCRYLCAGNYKQPFRSSETVSDKKENLFYYTETDDTGNFFAAARCSWIWIVFCVSETNYTSSNRK